VEENGRTNLLSRGDMKRKRILAIIAGLIMEILLCIKSWTGKVSTRRVHYEEKNF